jgi:phosphoglycolate phosphatase-like HAD superfamily hydrolase
MVYALDFDGVICDSIHECFQNSYHVFKSFSFELELPKQPKAVWREKFYRHRGLVRPGKNFYLLWFFIINNFELEISTVEFETITAQYETTLGLFDQKLMAIRREQIENDPDTFLLQNPLFPKVKSIWNQLPRPLYVVTAKDEEITKLILQYNELTIDGVFGKGTGYKYQTLLKLAKLHGVEMNSVYFVDDNPEFVNEARSVGANVALSKWGYGPYTHGYGKSLDSFKQVLDFFNNKH